MSGFGAVRTPDGDLTDHEPWELRAQLLALMACRGARAWIERIDTPTYLTTSYYGRWLLAGELGAVANGIVGLDDLTGWADRIRAGETVPEVVDDGLRGRVERFMTTTTPISPATSATFQVGDIVRVRRIHAPTVHHRVPRYVRGVVGCVESVCGEDRIAGHRDNQMEPFYTVRFSSADVWGAVGSEPSFAIHVDLWQSTLEAGS